MSFYCLLFLFQFLQRIHFLLFEEFVDAAKMLRHLLIAELVDLGHQSVKEVTVVRNDDQGAVEIHQCLLEDIFGFHVEVVGRLVQNQEVDRFQQELDHCQAGTFAAREHFHFLHRFFRSAEHEGAQQVTYLVADFSFCHVVNRLETVRFSSISEA